MFKILQCSADFEERRYDFIQILYATVSVYNMKQQQKPVQSHPSVTFVQLSLKIGSRDYVLLFFGKLTITKTII